MKTRGRCSTPWTPGLPYLHKAASRTKIPIYTYFFPIYIFQFYCLMHKIAFFLLSFHQEHFPWSFIYYQESGITNMTQPIHFLNNIFPWNNKHISSSSRKKCKSSTIWCWCNLYVCTLPVYYLFNQWLILFLTNNQPVEISRTQVLLTFTMLLFTMQIMHLKYQIMPERIHTYWQKRKSDEGKQKKNNFQLIPKSKYRGMRLITKGKLL